MIATVELFNVKREEATVKDLRDTLQKNVGFNKRTQFHVSNQWGGPLTLEIVARDLHRVWFHRPMVWRTIKGVASR